MLFCATKRKAHAQSMGNPAQATEEARRAGIGLDLLDAILPFRSRKGGSSMTRPWDWR
jgi:hypothetical protein